MSKCCKSEQKRAVDGELAVAAAASQQGPAIEPTKAASECCEQKQERSKRCGCDC